MGEYDTAARRNTGSETVGQAAQISYLTLAEVALRLHKSPRWLQARLADDRRKPDPRLQFHSRIGKTPLWTEAQYLALRDAISFDDAEKWASSSSSATATGMSMALSSQKDAASAFERVLALKHGLTCGRRQTPSGSGSKPKSAANSKARSAEVLTFRSRQKNI